MKSRISRTLWAALILSLSLHVTFWATLLVIDGVRIVAPKEDKIEVTILDDADKKKSKDHNTKLQIVEQDEKRINDEVPEKAKYLSRHDQTVIKETRASKAGQFNNTPGAVSPQPDVIARTDNKKKSEKKTEKPEDLKGIKVSDLKPKFNLQDFAEADSKNNPSAAGRGPASTNDYLPEVAVSAQTALSTREFVYYSYYHRIREQLRQQWEPRIRQKVKQIFSQGRTIASSNDRVTKVIIVLNNAGNLIKVQVISQSGVTDLDDAAVEAFRAAEPFPNPPKGIVDNDGMIRIRWDFVLEASWSPAQGESKQTARAW